MDTINVVQIDRKAESHHRTRHGAATAVADHARVVMERWGRDPITDAEHDIIRQAMIDAGELDLSIHKGLARSLPGVAIERAHAIAMAVSRHYVIAEVPLND